MEASATNWVPLQCRNGRHLVTLKLQCYSWNGEHSSGCHSDPFGDLENILRTPSPLAKTTAASTNSKNANIPVLLPSPHCCSQGNSPSENRDIISPGWDPCVLASTLSGLPLAKPLRATFPQHFLAFVFSRQPLEAVELRGVYLTVRAL
jgi:hypothetical protein